MTYADSVLEQMTALREAREGALSVDDFVTAANLQKSIAKLYDRYLALTGDID